jgi:hypothetical protein
MKKLLAYSILVALPAVHAFSAEFFVSPSGKDTDTGTATQPFATFARVREAVRAERKAHPDDAVTVTFAAGRYPLERALEFTPQDSGASANAPVIYRAAKGADVVIDGGKPISGWERDPSKPGVWRTRIDPQSGRFEQLWVNDRRAVRARTPNYWEFGVLRSVTEEPLDGQPGRMKHTFAFDSQDLAALKEANAEAFHDAQIVVFHKWDTTREWLDSVDTAAGRLTSPGSKMQSWNSMGRDSLFYIENCLPALDSPGEWFLDRDGWLYYLPRPGEDMTKAQVTAPIAEAFLVFKGSSRAGRVQHIQFEGLKFRHCEFRGPRAGLPPSQAAMNVDASAILTDGARGLRFSDCSVEHIGTTAIWFRHDVRDCTVEKSRMYDLGIAGVRIGEMAIVPEPERTGHITVDNCIVQSGGRLMPHAVGVWIGHSADNAITHCDVSDFFYTGVSVGWRWGYEQSAAKRNKIEFNHLHHFGYRILSDMGGVYTLGPSEGTSVSHNVIHNVYSTRYGGWGLYPDEGSTGIMFENNLVYNVRDGCVHQHYGKENVFRNNILAFSEEGQIAITRAEPHLSFTFERNIVYWDDGHLLGYSGWGNGARVALKTNLYWRDGGKPFDFAGKSWDQWRAASNDAGSIIADPMFVNAKGRDFRLRSESPAFKLGFKAFDFSQAGVYGDAAWKELANSLTYPKPYVVPGPRPLTIKDDFETPNASSCSASPRCRTRTTPS